MSRKIFDEIFGETSANKDTFPLSIKRYDELLRLESWVKNKAVPTFEFIKEISTELDRSQSMGLAAEEALEALPSEDK